MQWPKNMRLIDAVSCAEDECIKMAIDIIRN